MHVDHTNAIFDLDPTVSIPSVAGLAGVTVHGIDLDSRVLGPALDETLVTFDILLVCRFSRAVPQTVELLI